MGRVIALLLVSLLVNLPGLAGTLTLTGSAVGVTDGDTITVLDTDKVQHKIRLDGIDAPESNQGFGWSFTRWRSHTPEPLGDRLVKPSKPPVATPPPLLFPRGTGGPYGSPLGAPRDSLLRLAHP